MRQSGILAKKAMLEAMLTQLAPLPQNAIIKMSDVVREVQLPKGFVLLKSGKVEPNVYLIKKGIVRAYAQMPEGDVTFWFGSEGDIVLSMRSYVEGNKGYEDIELLEDCELYEVKAKDLQSLYVQDIHIANWGRKFAEKELIKTEERLISRLCKPATQRYQDLLENHPDLVKRIQLGHIASYLGITQVSLSRIRKQLEG